jgi:hypothetical protein
MADIRGNPWNFTTADVSTSIAITSITRNGARSATVVAALHGHAVNDYISIQNPSVSGWAGAYRIDSVIDANTFTVRIEDWRSSLANAGAQGNVLSILFPQLAQLIEVTQMLWDGPAASAVLSLTDIMGRTVWNPTSSATAGNGTLTYMKAFPINGLVINALPSGILQISI